MAIITTAQLRGYLDKVPSGTTNDDLLTDIIERAQGTIDAALGFSFFDAGSVWGDVAATEKRVQSERSAYLKLPAYKYGSIESIKPITGVRVIDAPITDYEETERQSYLLRPAGWGGGRWAITAQYGYGKAPPAIVEICLELAVNIWRQKGQGLFQQVQGVSGVGNAVGGGSLKYVGGINAEQRKTIAAVRRQYIDAVH